MSDPTIPSGYPPPGQPNPYGQQPQVPPPPPPNPYGQPPVSPPASPYGQPPYGSDPASTTPFPSAPDPYAQPAASQPYSGQPYSGQPYSGQPYSGQPYSGQPYPGAAPPPAKKSKTLLWVALGIVLVLLLCCGGVGTWFLVSENTADPVVTLSTDPSTSASPSVKASPSAKSKVTLTLPSSLGGRAKSSDPAMEKLVETMKESMESSLPGSGKTVAAIYGDILKDNMLMVVGIEGSFPLQTSVLDGLFQGFSSAGEITNVADVPPGPLGGKARCGDTKLSGIEVAPCAWIDEGSIGMIFFFSKKSSAVKSEFITLRSAIEKKA